MNQTKKITSQTLAPLSNSLKSRGQKHLTIIERTYQNNVDSDYTEKMWELAKNFDYDSNRDRYWANPELSLLYGTPLYEVASPSQKLALNHLFWTANYHYIAVSEASTRMYNMVTAGVFQHLGGYDKLCRELELETDRESYHIRSFQKISYNTKLALFGKAAFKNPLSGKSDRGLFAQLIPKPIQQIFSPSNYQTKVSKYQDNLMSAIAKQMLGDKKQYYSAYLKELEQKKQPIAAVSEGILGQIASRDWLSF